MLSSHDLRPRHVALIVAGALLLGDLVAAATAQESAASGPTPANPIVGDLQDPTAATLPELRSPDASPELDLARLLRTAPVCQAPPAALHSTVTLGGALELGVDEQAINQLEILREQSLRFRRGAIETGADGVDTSLGMWWEPTIAIDPNDPRVVAVSQFTTVRLSFDGGANFTQNLTGRNVDGTTNNLGGDPSLAFDSQGRLFLTYLCSQASGRDVCIAGWQCDADNATCTSLGGAVNLAAAAGQGGNNADKEWLAADATPGSPYVDRLYVVWSRLDTDPWRVYATWSDDQGATWSTAQQLSQADEEKVWPSHIGVGPDGVVYAAWHSQTGFLDGAAERVPDGVSGQIVLRRSDDGGANWEARSFPFGPAEADMTWNIQHGANGVISGSSFWLFGSSQPWVLPDPLSPGWLYIVANDDPDDDIDTGDPGDVFIVSSSDSGVTWSAPIRVDNGPVNTMQVMPTAAIDPVTGAIAVAWYDDRNDGDLTNRDLDLMMALSTDGGLNWSAEVDFNDGMFNAENASFCRFCGNPVSNNNTFCNTSCPAPRTTRIGEYNGVAFGQCTPYAAWADNGVSDDIDTYIDLDPLLTGDVDEPDLTCPAPAVLSCTEAQDPSVTGEPTVSDQCDLDPTVGFADTAGSPVCPQLELFTRTWTATDAATNQATCDQQISVVDLDPPVVTAPDPIALECNAEGGVPITDPVIVDWLDDATAVDECTEADLSNDAPALFPVGCGLGQATPVTFTGTDQCGASDFDISTVTVVDTTPPTVECDVELTELWPVNHAFVDVGFTFSEADVCSPGQSSVVISVTSDEATGPSGVGDGSPDFCGDAIVTPDDRVLLRSERSGTADGRVYQITVTATDPCGNVAQCQKTISVPMSQGGNGAAVDSGQNFDALQCN